MQNVTVDLKWLFDIIDSNIQGYKEAEKHFEEHNSIEALESLRKQLLDFIKEANKL